MTVFVAFVIGLWVGAAVGVLIVSLNVVNRP